MEETLRLSSQQPERTEVFATPEQASNKGLLSFTVHMGVFDKGIPERLAEYALILCKETGEFRIQEVIFLELSQRGDTGRAPEGRRALSATRYIDEPPERLVDEDLRRVVADLLGDLEVFFLFKGKRRLPGYRKMPYSFKKLW